MANYRTHYLIRTFEVETGKIVSEEYRQRWRLHRDPKTGPAYVFYSGDGNVCEAKYYWYGKLHRVDGPANMLYSDDRTLLLTEMYYRRGLLHRDPKQGPAWIVRNNSGVITTESYFLHGTRYRDPADGPSYVERNRNGKTEWEEYSENGVAPVSRPRRLTSDPKLVL